MANPNPTAARVAAAQTRKRRGAGDIEKLRAVLWRAIQRLEECFKSTDELDAEAMKAIHALSQVAGVFLKTVEAGEMNDRITLLEQKT